MTNADQLRELKRIYGLTSKGLAKIIGYSGVTVTAWLRNNKSQSHRPLKDRTLRSIKLSLRGRKKV